ncbi:MAG TPA: LuxR C-terminal-related transcriptional regulator [Streptosporangiaceae bacterium]|nr:LuxR C-terminal-related transcriptional regulator [Streptosporangiaceae bacterium]
MRDSRVCVPQLPLRHVPRPRLLAELDQTADRPLTLLSAGPGAGKTVLLTDWARRGGARIAWLTPTAADAEPRRFWRLLESALRDGGGAEGGPPAATPRAVGVDLVQALFSRVPEPETRLVVVVDDAHQLTHPDVLAGLDSLIRGGQPGLRLILAARSDPLLPLHRYRLAGQMHELRAADLAMTPHEIAEVLSVHGITLAARDFSILATRTEGWAAGVQLSAMRMEGTEYPADFVSELALDPGSIGEYLVNEVLRHQPEPQRRLLIETSFLPEVTGSLADAVTGMTGCADMLTGLARENAFVIPLDATQHRYRYHELFAEILRYLLQRQRRQAIRILQERAAAWFEGGGDLGNAVYWAGRAGNRHHVARLLARGGFAHAFVHRQDLSGLGLRELLPLQPPAGSGAVRATEFAVASAVIEAVFADADTAFGLLERLTALKSDDDRPDPELLVTCDLLELRLGQKAHAACAVDAAADRLLGRSGDAPAPAMPGLRAAVLLAQASSHLWHGRHEDVGALLDEALAEARGDEMAALELEVLGMIAFVESYWSRTHHAQDAEQRAHALRAHKNLGISPALELAAALRSLVAGDVGGRMRSLQRILLPDVVGSDPGLAVALVLGQASVLMTRGEVNEARVMLQEAGRRIPPLLAVRRDVMLADLDTSLGRPHAALKLLGGYRGGQLAILTAIPSARAHLALGDLRSAQDCVRTVLTTPSTQTGRFVLVEAMLCDAEIAQRSDDPGRALEILIRALEIAQGEIVLPFLNMKDVFAVLLTRHPLVAGQWPASQPRMPADPGAGRPAVNPRELPEPLTQRELTILRLLATSMSTAEIADELCLSVNTVKTHLAAIYRKLPASRRREAVVRARELELI